MRANPALQTLNTTHRLIWLLPVPVPVPSRPLPASSTSMPRNWPPWACRPAPMCMTCGC